MSQARLIHALSASGLHCWALYTFICPMWLVLSIHQYLCRVLWANILVLNISSFSSLQDQIPTDCSHQNPQGNTLVSLPLISVGAGLGWVINQAIFCCNKYSCQAVQTTLLQPIILMSLPPLSPFAYTLKADLSVCKISTATWCFHFDPDAFFSFSRI